MAKPIKLTLELLREEQRFFERLEQEAKNAEAEREAERAASMALIREAVASMARKGIAPKDIVLKDIVLEDGRRLIFVEPLISPNTTEDKCLTADIDKLEIYFCWKDKEALLNDFGAHIGSVWDEEDAGVAAEKLSQEALRLKERLLAYIREYEAQKAGRD